MDVTVMLIKHVIQNKKKIMSSHVHVINNINLINLVIVQAENVIVAEEDGGKNKVNCVKEVLVKSRIITIWLFKLLFNIRGGDYAISTCHVKCSILFVYWTFL